MAQVSANRPKVYTHRLQSKDKTSDDITAYADYITKAVVLFFELVQWPPDYIPRKKGDNDRKVSIFKGPPLWTKLSNSVNL